MSFENSAGLGVNNSYGARSTGGSIGVETTKDSTYNMSIAFTGASANGTFLPPVVVPKGALLKSATLRVDEAFSLGVSGTLTFGGTTPGTNGIVLTKAKLEAQGTSNVSTLAIGTWATASATGTTAAEKVKQAIGVSVSAAAGKGTLILEFSFKAKA